MGIFSWTLSFPKTNLTSSDGNGKMMSSNEQTEERLSKGFIQSSSVDSAANPRHLLKYNSNAPRSRSTWLSRSRGSQRAPVPQRLSRLCRVPFARYQQMLIAMQNK